MTIGVATRRVVLIGNPNTGKTTLFNALTGLSQRVGNYPGVTVEKKTGRFDGGVELVDLPGTYSLAAQSPDEMLAVDVLLGRRSGEARPNAAIVIVDASNLRRNLYLVTQIIETGLPALVALNMVDLARSAGIDIDTPALSRALGVPVVPMVASKGQGIDELRTFIQSLLDSPPTPTFDWEWPDDVLVEVDRLSAMDGVPDDRFLVTRALIDSGGEAEAEILRRANSSFPDALKEARERIQTSLGPPAAVEARMRYDWIGTTLQRCVTESPTARPSPSHGIDAILTHRVLGTLVFLTVMGVVFMSIFQWAAPLMELIGGAFDSLADRVSALLSGTALAGGMLESLIVNGIIAGVGGVLIFIPQIVFLFFFIAILEDCGYMARTAYLMDRLLRFCGLSGHSFIPMLSSFACAIPGVMAARTISNRRDRLTTILVAPLMSCSARIPVYTLMIAAFVPAVVVGGVLSLQGLVFGAMYLLGILVAIPVAMVLKKTILRGPTPPFVMELPPYRVPSVRSVLMRVYQATSEFIRNAGTIILAMSIVVWALGYFPHARAIGERFDAERTVAEATVNGDALDAELRGIDSRESGAYLRDSFLGRAGRWVEPVVEPLGWDWKIGMATIASFPAREVVVSTLGVIYDLGEGDEGETGSKAALIDRLQSARWPDGRKVFTLPVALSIMVFFALCCQCGATVATIRRETNGWGWPGFVFTYMTVLAYLCAFVTFRVGRYFLG